jgi:hypothetical protein
MMNFIFWDKTPCSPLKVSHRENKWKRELSCASHLLSPSFFYDPENGGNSFLRNVGLLSTEYTRR